VATAVLASPESARVEVQASYQRFLHRSADSAGLDAFTTALQRGVPIEVLLATLDGSDEYLGRL
jgi:hypothetical protein